MRDNMVNSNHYCIHCGPSWCVEEVMKEEDGELALDYLRCDYCGTHFSPTDHNRRPTAKDGGG